MGGITPLPNKHNWKLTDEEKERGKRGVKAARIALKHSQKAPS